MDEGLNALFGLCQDDGELRIRDERHYRLVPHTEIRATDLASYRVGAEP